MTEGFFTAFRTRTSAAGVSLPPLFLRASAIPGKQIPNATTLSFSSQMMKVMFPVAVSLTVALISTELSFTSASASRSGLSLMEKYA